jgi:hypothetical protein
LDGHPHFLSRYFSSHECPVANSSQRVIVLLSLTLNAIIDVNEKDQIITLNAWLKYVS